MFKSWLNWLSSSYFKIAPKHSRHSRRSQPARDRLCLEPLETRLAPTVTLTDGHLVITGDTINAPSDRIDLRVTPSGGVGASIFRGDHLSQSALFAPGQVSSIDINPGNDVNQVNVFGTPAGVPLRINSINGADNVKLGDNSFNSQHSLSSLQGPVTISGNSLGSVILDDSDSGVSHTYTITNTSLSRDDFGGLTYNAIRSFTLDSSSASNSFNVNSTFPGTSYDLRPSKNSSTSINVGTGNLDAIAGHVDVGLRAGDQIVLHDEAYALTRNYSMQESDDQILPNVFIPGISLSRDGFSFLTAIGPTVIDLKGGAGNNTYNVEGDVAASLTINAGNGNDAFNLSPASGNLDDVSRSLTLNGGGGANSGPLPKRGHAAIP